MPAMATRSRPQEGGSLVRLVELSPIHNTPTHHQPHRILAPTATATAATGARAAATSAAAATAAAAAATEVFLADVVEVLAGFWEDPEGRELILQG